MGGGGGYGSEGDAHCRWIETRIAPTVMCPRTVLVDRVRWDLSPKSTFPCKKSGKEISYKDYMRERYQIKNAALDENQPLLENVSKREHDREGKPKVRRCVPCARGIEARNFPQFFAISHNFPQLFFACPPSRACWCPVCPLCRGVAP